MKHSVTAVVNIFNSRTIFEYIENNNLTHKEFCNHCGISISTFYRILNGKNCNLISLFKISRKVNVPLHKLFK